MEMMRVGERTRMWEVKTRGSVKASVMMRCRHRVTSGCFRTLHLTWFQNYFLSSGSYGLQPPWFLIYGKVKSSSFLPILNISPTKIIRNIRTLHFLPRNSHTMGSQRTWSSPAAWRQSYGFFGGAGSGYDDKLCGILTAPSSLWMVSTANPSISIHGFPLMIQRGIVLSPSFRAMSPSSHTHDHTRSYSRTETLIFATWW